MQKPYRQHRQVGYARMGNVIPLNRHLNTPADAQNFIESSGYLSDIQAETPLRLFQKRTALFMRRSFPFYCKNFTGEDLQRLALIIQDFAARRHIITEKQIWNYTIILVYCGFFFAEDVQYDGMLRLIGWYEDYSDKELLLDRLLDIIEDYTQECVKDYAHFDKKLRYLAQFYMEPQFSAALLQGLSEQRQCALAESLLGIIFPVRAALWTVENKRRMIMLGLNHAQKLGFMVKDSLFYLLAVIYFGRSFEQSPLYPWAHFLQDRRLSAAERAKYFISALQKHFMQLAGG